MKVLKFAVSPLLAVAGGLLKKKSKDAPTALPPVTRDSVRELADKRDELRRRRGGAADIVAGWGAEPAAVGKATLGS
jgi:hypothetical protein